VATPGDLDPAFVDGFELERDLAIEGPGIHPPHPLRRGGSGHRAAQRALAGIRRDRPGADPGAVETEGDHPHAARSVGHQPVQGGDIGLRQGGGRPPRQRDHQREPANGQRPSSAAPLAECSRHQRLQPAADGLGPGEGAGLPAKVRTRDLTAAPSDSLQHLSHPTLDLRPRSSFDYVEVSRDSIEKTVALIRPRAGKRRFMSWRRRLPAWDGRPTPPARARRSAPGDRWRDRPRRRGRGRGPRP
jgi:hypothetical protein